MRKLKKEYIHLFAVIGSVTLAIPMAMQFKQCEPVASAIQTKEVIETVLIVEEEAYDDIYQFGENLYSVPQELVKAIEMHETGSYTSELYEDKNNTFGCKTSSGNWCWFDSKEQSTLELYRTLAFKYKVVDDYYNLDHIADEFCTQGCDAWVSEVKWFRDELVGVAYEQ